MTADTDSVIAALRAYRPVVWHNPHRVPWGRARDDIPFAETEIQKVRDRFHRWAPTLAALFPGEPWLGEPGVIAGPLIEHDSLLLKLDSQLPVAGSIKARGGIHEVLLHAEEVCAAAGVPALPVGPQTRQVLQRHTVAVGSTGNLGLSIGTMARALGFRAEVHMSADARQWKKDLLRSRGAVVHEYQEDYSVAVDRGRRAAAADSATYFVDDENSPALFLGYSVAGRETAEQLAARGLTPTEEQPLTVYLPCGVGGGPGGVCFGLKEALGDAVRCFFVEPTHAPAMMLGLVTDRHHRICVGDIGLDTRTVADGLAVGRPSGFVGQALRRVIDGCITVHDRDMLRWLRAAGENWDLRMEPSAAAGVAAWERLRGGQISGRHLAWITGGRLLPDAEYRRYTRLR